MIEMKTSILSHAYRWPLHAHKQCGIVCRSYDHTHRSLTLRQHYTFTVCAGKTSRVNGKCIHRPLLCHRG